jgi:flavin-dependent dehydrogenase
VRVAVVGAGPAGATLARRLAEDGAAVTIFDASHPREKPCGGGLTAKAVARLPEAPFADPLPARFVERCRFDSGAGDHVELGLHQAVAVAARRELDAWLLRRALDKGARHLAERVVALDGAGTVRTGAGREQRFDVVAGADGAGSLVRRSFLSPTPRERLAFATGWYARGTAPMLVRFLPGLAGYLWLFPRPDHVAVGIAAPLGAASGHALVARLEAEAARHYPPLVELEGGRYAHTIPSPSADPASILEIAGPGWALVGDAAALADPITGEGLYYALRSAELLAEALREEGSPARYPERVLEDFGRELNRAAALHDRFYAPGFTRRMIRYSAWSPTIREVLGELVLGSQGYLGLRRRLLRAGPRFLLEAGLARLTGTA